MIRSFKRISTTDDKVSQKNLPIHLVNIKRANN